MEFHPKCGKVLYIAKSNTLAVKDVVSSEDALVFTRWKLTNDKIFIITIIKKYVEDTWSTNFKVGITTVDPNEVRVIPKHIEDLHKISPTWWIFSDVVASAENPEGCKYGVDVDSLHEGDQVGISRSSSGNIEFFVNGQSMGIVERNVPDDLYGVVDLCGQVYMICIHTKMSEVYSHLGGQTSSLSSGDYQTTSSLCLQPELDVNVVIPPPIHCNFGAIPKDRTYKYHYTNDALRFHKKTGSLVKLSGNRRSAQRRHPLDEFNNGVVMTHRCLGDNELFEIRIDRLVDKWSGSIEMGVTTHDPGAMEFPATMTNMRSGTIMMSGCGILTNGRGTRREYGNYNLDQLQAGDRVGLVRMQNGDLHYFINGNDQGVAATRVNQHVWGVVDLYGMTVKVSIVEQGDEYFEEADDTGDEEVDIRPACSRMHIPVLPPTVEEMAPSDCILSPSIPFLPCDMLTFHPKCGPHAVVVNDGLTAFRPHAAEDYNAAIVFTRRPLKNEELFEVVLEEVVGKWAGSLEIGVTTHHPCAQNSSVPPSILSLRDVWMLTNVGVKHNSTTIKDNWPNNKINQLEVGDCIGVMRQSSGVLKFFINKIDQGIAITDIPPVVYGVIDLYGQAGRVSIVPQNHQSPDSPNSSASNATIHGNGDLAFHRLCGGNLRLNKVRTVATRIFPDVFEDNLLLSCRSLREFEMFQVRVDKKLHHPGSTFMIGVTPSINKKSMPERACELSKDVYLLEKDTLYCKKMVTGYSLNMDNVPEGSLVGVMRHADRSVHFYLDGVDHGKAWTINSLNLYAIVELNGFCTQITVVPPDARAFGNSENSQLYTADSSQKQHSFSEYCGSNIRLSSDLTLACIKSAYQAANLVFSSSTLKADEIFQFEIVSHTEDLVGSMRIGVTDLNVLNAHVNKRLPCTLELLSANTCYIESNWIVASNQSFVKLFHFNLTRLKTKDIVGLKRVGNTGCVALNINSEEIGIVFKNVPLHAFLVFELCGPITAIKAVSMEHLVNEDRDENAHSLHLIESLHIDDALHPTINTNYYHGCNIQVDNEGGVIKRLSNYNHGIVIKNQPIHRGQYFQFNVLRINKKWKGGLIIGIGAKYSSPNLPSTAANLKGTWLVSYNHLFLGGYIRPSEYGEGLAKVMQGSKVSIVFKDTGDLVMIIDDTNYGSFVKITDTSTTMYPIIDVYGQCEEISIPTLDHLGGNESAGNDCSGAGKSEPVLSDKEKADLEYREKEHPENEEETDSDEKLFNDMSLT